MADVNRVFLVGRLTRDAEIKYTASNFPVCEFSLAVKTARREGEGWTEEPMFINRISLWGKRAEAISEHLLKGRQILLEGRLGVDEWEKDGQKRRELRIVATNVELLSVPRGETGADALKEEGFPKPDSDLVEEDDLPF